MDANFPIVDYRDIHRLLNSAFADRDPLAATYTAALTIGLNTDEIIAAAWTTIEDDVTGIWLPTQIWMPKIGELRSTFNHHPIGPRTAEVLRWHRREKESAATEAGDLWQNPGDQVFTDATGRPSLIWIGDSTTGAEQSGSKRGTGAPPQNLGIDRDALQRRAPVRGQRLAAAEFLPDRDQTALEDSNHHRYPHPEAGDTALMKKPDPSPGHELAG